MNERLRLLVAEVRQNVARLGCADCLYSDGDTLPWRLEDKDARDSIASALAMMEYELDTPKKPVPTGRFYGGCIGCGTLQPIAECASFEAPNCSHGPSAQRREGKVIYGDQDSPLCNLKKP